MTELAPAIDPDLPVLEVTAQHGDEVAVAVINLWHIVKVQVQPQGSQGTTLRRIMPASVAATQCPQQRCCSLAIPEL